jgi:hypothetical protein
MTDDKVLQASPDGEDAHSLQRIACPLCGEEMEESKKNWRFYCRNTISCALTDGISRFGLQLLNSQLSAIKEEARKEGELRILEKEMRVR